MDPTAQFTLKPRGSHLKTALIVTYTVLFIVYCLVIYPRITESAPTPPEIRKCPGKPDFIYYMYITASAVLILIAAEILYRVVLFSEELNQRATRYDGNIYKIILETFHVKYLYRVLLAAGMSAAIFLFLWKRYPETTEDFITFYTPIFVTQCFMNAVILAVLGLRGPCKVEESDNIEQTQSGIAHGLAWSYYFGYLKLVLPGIDERIRNSKQYEATLSNPKAVKMSMKFIILMPESCYCPDSLSKADQRIQHCGSLEPFTASRAGNIGRQYRNHLYSFTNDRGQEFYCAVEYATPLLSLYDMVLSPVAKLQEDDKLYQMKMFYTTLCQILSSDPAVSDSVLVLPFKDVDENGGKVQISSLLAEAIQEDTCLYG